jgi:hypothetical protein
MMVVRVPTAIHQPTARPVRSRSARGCLPWLRNDMNTSHRSAKTAALPSHRARGFAASIESLLLTVATLAAAPRVALIQHLNALA